jgi:hypothetical protein
MKCAHWPGTMDKMSQQATSWYMDHVTWLVWSRRAILLIDRVQKHALTHTYHAPGLCAAQPLNEFVTGLELRPTPNLDTLFLCRQDLYVIPLPQTLRVTPNRTNLARWGLTSLNVTAGDWVRLEARGKEPVLLQQPLILSGDVIFTGAVVGDVARPSQSSTADKPILQCPPVANSTAISIRYAGRHSHRDVQLAHNCSRDSTGM